MIKIYTDGSCLKNPGKGGWAAIINNDGDIKKVSGGEKNTTNNRMELLAVIVALEMIKQPNNDVMIFSDSKYVIDSVEKKWVFGWQKKGFKGKKNVDLWQRFLKIYPSQNVKFTWVKGHAGNLLNERVDALAVGGAESENLLVDEQYEANDSEGLL